MTRSARVRAYAKLNLGLRVLYKRPDGYHELRTVFQTISLADELEISCASAKQTSVVIEGTPEIPDNLADRAARAVLDAAGRHAAVRIRLRKRIPSGAGLGGGSSDAAAVLLALPVLAGFRIAMPDLAALGAQLGSDVPFFLYGGTALGLGRGEELYPLPDGPRTRALVVVPDVHSSTAEAYRGVSATLTTDALQNKLNSFQSEVWQFDKSNLINDFEDVVVARYASLAKVREKLRAAGANRVAMSGSGSAFFAIFDNASRLARAQKTFEDQRAFPVNFIGRAQYQRAWQRALQGHRRENNTWPPPSRHAR